MKGRLCPLQREVLLFDVGDAATKRARTPRPTGLGMAASSYRQVARGSGGLANSPRRALAGGAYSPVAAGARPGAELLGRNRRHLLRVFRPRTSALDPRRRARRRRESVALEQAADVLGRRVLRRSVLESLAGTAHRHCLRLIQMLRVHGEGVRASRRATKGRGCRVTRDRKSAGRPDDAVLARRPTFGVTRSGRSFGWLAARQLCA